MTGHTVAVSANVLRSLRQREAGEALRGVLDARPDLVGLQEWDLRRRRLLTRIGSPGYVWAIPLMGECPVGARTDRFELLGHHSRRLAWFGWSDPGARPLRVVPLRMATVAHFLDRAGERTVSVINFHLTPGVQARGEYRSDRPRLVAHHRHEVRNLGGVVAEELTRGHTVYAMGDSNFDGLRLPGLTSAWEGRGSDPGTLGPRRKIDDVFGPGPADSVRLLTSASDHKAVVVARRDLP
jgi:endonuclease/exonuclease/phosphatase family metal-dependent hydrolase